MKITANQGWKLIGGNHHYFRSDWEVRYALHLECLKRKGLISEWFYEPKTFWFEDVKRGVRSYKPDFKIIQLDGSHYWVEVKGYMDGRSKTKLKRFKKYYPEETIILVDSAWFKKNTLLSPGKYVD